MSVVLVPAVASSPLVAAALPVAAPEGIAEIFLELGLAVAALGLLARFAARLGISPIPLYLVLGVLLSGSGPLSLHLSQDFIALGGEIGVILLLFMLGLEFTSEELVACLRGGLGTGAVDLALNFSPGFAAGLFFGWGLPAAVVLGGVTYISSSGVIAKLLSDLNRLGNLETPTILTVLVLEDLAMAVYLPLVAVLLLGSDLRTGLISLAIALGAIVLVMLLAFRYGERLGHALASRSDEVVLLSAFGLILIVGGVAQQLQVSAGVGAFLLGMALSGEFAGRARALLGPLRDLFAAFFFLFFGLQVEVAALPPVLLPAIVLGIVTAATKLATGWFAAGRDGVGRHGRLRAGVALIARGEFSVVIAGLAIAAGIDPRVGAFAAAYVLILATAGPVLVRLSDPLIERLPTGPAAAGPAAVQDPVPAALGSDDGESPADPGAYGRWPDVG